MRRKYCALDTLYTFVKAQHCVWNMYKSVVSQICQISGTDLYTKIEREATEGPGLAERRVSYKLFYNLFIDH